MKILAFLLPIVLMLLSACGGGEDTNPPANIPNTIITTTPALDNQTAASATPTGSNTAAISGANSCNLPNFQVEMLRAVNEARAQARTCGSTSKPAVGPVTWNNQLFIAAAGHSLDMAQKDYFSHTSQDGRTPGNRAQNAGYNYRALGENIAAGQIGIASVMTGWLNSEGHCNGIMNGNFTEVAVACVTTTRPRFPTYWTMALGKPL